MIRSFKLGAGHYHVKDLTRVSITHSVGRVSVTGPGAPTAVTEVWGEDQARAQAALPAAITSQQIRGCGDHCATQSFHCTILHQVASSAEWLRKIVITCTQEIYSHTYHTRLNRDHSTSLCTHTFVGIFTNPSLVCILSRRIRSCADTNSRTTYARLFWKLLPNYHQERYYAFHRRNLHCSLDISWKR